MKGNPVRGASYLLRGAAMLPQPGIRHFVLVPLMVNVLLFIGAIWLLIEQFGVWVDYWLSFLPGWADFLTWLFWPVFALLVLVTVYYGFSIVANLIAAPFNGFLSEKVEKKLRGAPVTDEGWAEMLAMIPRALQRELHKLAYYLPRFLLVLIITFIPGVNLIAPVLWFLFGAWMMSIQYCDYPMDNNKVSFRQMKQLMKARRVTSIGFGGLVQLGMLVPVINLILMPAAVVGATIFWVEEYASEARDITPRR
ncbi:sulfate transporter CysZ [Marinobacterium sediminicola]|uniref:Sulfate transporter CysZ n=1 Tax=Marinobacterium sediminicola TaxID=518898 RepID=A0ABY1RZ53_9GAMM|nr:sulfate transporter CysZ [Marinobacterium sediminicola]ULG69130.1 sulfate transporter CysZ [Marinobacterium sediminicola]SMR73589.1 CysZ protein [Marinobacterium sediminicola]